VKKNLLFAFIAFTFIASCTKISNTEIGNGLIPAIDGVATGDTTIDVNTFNVLLDSIRVSKYQEMVLGNIDNDPLMGKTKAIINAEFKPTYFPYYYEVSNKIDPTTLKDSLKLDSVVLVLGYQGLWGDTTNPINLKVYEISQTSFLKTDSVYSNNSSMNIAGQIGGVTIADPRKLKDSIFPFQEAAANQIRIPLTTAFGLKLLKEYDSSNVYQSEAQFSSTFHGISIVPQTGSNTLLRVSLTDTNSKVALYYKYTKRDGKGDSAVVKYFRTGATAGASNNIIRNRAGSQANTYLSNPATDKDSLLFLQAGPGNYIRIKTPGLSAVKNRVIHRAELIMEQESDNINLDSIYTAPNLFLCAVQANDSAYRFYVPYDVSLGQGGIASNLGSFGGYINYKIAPNGRRVASYSFNISRYVQSIITRGESIFDLYLFAPVNDYVYSGNGTTGEYQISTTAFNAPACGRVRLLGGNSLQKDRRMRIRIIYSKL
jgi:hypothetical protein